MKDLVVLYLRYLMIRVGLIRVRYSWDAFDLIVYKDYYLKGVDVRNGVFRPHQRPSIWDVLTACDFSQWSKIVRSV